MVTALAGLLVGSLAVPATPAQAHTTIHCTPPAGLADFHATEDRWLSVFRADSITEIFQKSEGRFAQNTTDSPQTVTFTSQVARTFTFSSNFNFQVDTQRQIVAGVQQTTRLGISVTLTVSTTTTIGVNVTATVPPHTTVNGDYGVRSFVITGLLRVYHFLTCKLQGESLFTMTVTSVDQGWRTSQQPLLAIVNERPYL